MIRSSIDFVLVRCLTIQSKRFELVQQYIQSFVSKWKTLATRSCWKCIYYVNQQQKNFFVFIWRWNSTLCALITFCLLWHNSTHLKYSSIVFCVLFFYKKQFSLDVLTIESLIWIMIVVCANSLDFLLCSFLCFFFWLV